MKLIKLIILLLFSHTLLCQQSDASLTTQVDTDIRNKTSPSSITRTNVADAFQSLIDSKVSILAPRLTTTSTNGYPWIASGTGGLGGWSQIGIGTGVSGLGTSVATALGVNVGSAGSIIVNGGALGTPSSGTLTNATGLPPTTGIVGWPSNASGVLTNNGSGTLSWGSGGTISGLTVDRIPVATSATGIGNTGIVYETGGGGIINILKTSTSDGSDTFYLALAGGGGTGLGRGANIVAYGNDHVGNAGNLSLSAGDAGGIIFVANSSQVAKITVGELFGFGTTSPDRKFHVEQNSAATNTVTYLQRLTSTSSGTPANGIGVGEEFEVETAAGNNEVGAIIEAITTDVTATSEDFDLVFKTMAAGAAAAERIRITSDGRLYGTALHNNSGDVTGTTNQHIASGTYTPTLTNTTNIDASVSAVCQWIRVGNVVTVSGLLQVDITTTLAYTEMGVSLPIASNFTSPIHCAGVGTSASNEQTSNIRIIADGTNDRATFGWTGQVATTNYNFSFTFTYLIL